MLHSFIGFLFDVITCKLQWNKKEAKVGDTIILSCNVKPLFRCKNCMNANERVSLIITAKNNA